VRLFGFPAAPRSEPYFFGPELLRELSLRGVVDRGVSLRPDELRAFDVRRAFEGRLRFGNLGCTESLFETVVAIGTPLG